MVSTQEAPAGVKVVDDIGVVDAGGTTGIAYALGPDGVKIELLERKAQTAPIMSHHLHFFGDKQSEMHAWYIKVFGAAARSAPGNGFIGADLPGVGLNFSPSATPRAGTKGRALDHIGFEVKNLEAFCKGLEAQGIKLEVPYRKVPALNIAIAFISDPWGTYIELTEGLDKVP
jgi:catechol 2,3-dioxygenase-like lactoylglutathione lyase family enzyme